MELRCEILGDRERSENALQGIRPHLWFDTQAVEAARFYAQTFPNSRVGAVSQIPDTPSGDVDVVAFEVLGQRFEAISAGPLFRFTPAISFFVGCESDDEIDRLWAALSDGGTEMMPLDAYPWSKRYGWVADRYGLSWQLGVSDGGDARRIVPTLMFTGDAAGKAEEAARFYASVFDGSLVGEVDRYDSGDEHNAEGTARYLHFDLMEQPFAAMDSGFPHGFGFNEAISLVVPCETQAEIDRYWSALSAVPEAEQCGWLKDRFGVSWQIVPTMMDEVLAHGSAGEIARVTEAFLQMKKFDVAELERARRGG